MLLCISGKINSGKTTFAEELSQRVEWPKVSFGDFVRKEARKSGLDSSRKTLQELGESLLNHDIEFFCQSVLAQANWIHKMPLIVEGVRHQEVLDTLREIAAPERVVLIYITTEDSVRFSRISANEQEVTDEKHSTETQVQDILLNNADVVISNNDSVEKAVSEAIVWIKNETSFLRYS